MPPPVSPRDAPSVTPGYPRRMDTFGGATNVIDGIRVGIGGWTAWQHTRADVASMEKKIQPI